MRPIIMAFGLTVWACAPAFADSQICALLKVDEFLKADAEKTHMMYPDQPKDREGLVPRLAKCPPPDKADLIEYVNKYQVVPVEDDIDAVLLDTQECGTGNKHGQYLVIAKGASCELITEPEIGDMHFIAHDIYATDDGVTLQGHKWTGDDPHCCPSREGTLDYQVSTGAYTFKLHEMKK